MIERDDVMSNKKFNIEELEKQYLETEMHLEDIREQLNKAKKKEEEMKQEKLRVEKEARKKELDEAFEKWDKLRKEFIRDYGCYSTSASESFKDIDSTIEKLFKFGWF
jgi:predicted  nucleic acid-binding Zn-ribbon protein